MLLGKQILKWACNIEQLYDAHNTHVYMWREPCGSYFTATQIGTHFPAYLIAVDSGRPTIDDDAQSATFIDSHKQG